MTDTADLLGPIDYAVIEFEGNRFNGEVIPALTRLIAQGTVRVLDIAFVLKDGEGSVVYGEIEDLGDEIGPLAELADFLANIVTEEDLAAAAEELPPNSSAVLIVWENTWAAPFVRAVRASGGELVASGRVPANELLELLDATD